MLFNQQVYQKLPAASRAGSVQAILLEYDISGNAPKPLWLFLVNPQGLKFSNTAEYTEIKPLGNSVSEQQYVATSGRSLSISEIVMQTWYYGRSLKPLFDGIQELLKADIKNNKYSPPVLKFQMGSREFGPCVLSSVQWDESAWLGGEPASVTMSLEFKEVPKVTNRGQVEKAKTEAIAAAKNTRETSGKPRIPLSDRQKSDASTAAEKYLQANITTWSADIQSSLRSKSYKLATNSDTGAVLLSTRVGSPATVLIWDGAKGKAGQGITTVPLSKDKKVPEL